MESTKHMRLTGHADAFAVTHAAHERLLRYLAEARTALTADPDGDETIRDLEATLGDRLRAVLESSGGPVDDTQMARVLVETGPVQSHHPVGDPSPGRPLRGPFWCRIEEGKWFGGICVGIAARGEFRLDWVRTVVVLLMLVTAGFIGLVYLALLLLLPRVETVEEYRRLRDTPRSAT
ncbi:PspC domain-containing protein [Myceligenerans pegani]|uniref:PspC domain-containing protein n=1 Tax=Myceligenerans pegani TaxID=2776917 RepID=A0ABR9N2E9_9MICO|nr:PspC domain-containing protein [Myceligenerans sp. TRM 65318]MBE1877829.1 PspC domain-containing protein [Myceligenerans sp. TRM 65318]MBE3020100.1 PspC domain-containing protein [Myceligenerans sp. TRM 65318]